MGTTPLTLKWKKTSNEWFMPLLGDLTIHLNERSGPIVIGRDANCHIQVHQLVNTVSSFHACLFYYSERWWVVDLGSIHGTTVINANGDRIDPHKNPGGADVYDGRHGRRTPFGRGDEIQLAQGIVLTVE